MAAYWRSDLFLKKNKKPKKNARKISSVCRLTQILRKMYDNISFKSESTNNRKIINIIIWYSTIIFPWEI